MLGDVLGFKIALPQSKGITDEPEECEIRCKIHTARDGPEVNKHDLSERRDSGWHSYKCNIDEEEIDEGLTGVPICKVLEEDPIKPYKEDGEGTGIPYREC